MSFIWVHNINPYLVKLNSFELTYYWAFYPISFLVIFLLTSRERGQFGISFEHLTNLFMSGWIGLLLGARVGYALLYHFKYFSQNPLQFFAIHEGGMSFHGAIVGTVLGVLFTCKRHKLKFLDATDLITVFAPIALFLGRIGNFIGQELIGRPTYAGWGVVFPRHDQIPRHPSQLYEAALEGFILFLILYHFRKTVWRSRGLASAVFVTLYSAFRFGAEFFREPDPQLGLVAFHLTLGQMLCLVSFALGLVLLYKSTSQAAKKDLLS